MDDTQTSLRGVSGLCPLLVHQHGLPQLQRFVTDSPSIPLKVDTKLVVWASLVAQWIRICLPMQGTQVHSLVQEDPTCHGATKPVCHNY